MNSEFLTRRRDMRVAAAGREARPAAAAAGRDRDTRVPAAASAGWDRDTRRRHCGRRTRPRHARRRLRQPRSGVAARHLSGSGSRDGQPADAEATVGLTRW